MGALQAEGERVAVIITTRKNKPWILCTPLSYGSDYWPYWLCVETPFPHFGRLRRPISPDRISRTGPGKYNLAKTSNRPKLSIFLWSQRVLPVKWHHPQQKFDRKSLFQEIALVIFFIQLFEMSRYCLGFWSIRCDHAKNGHSSSRWNQKFKMLRKLSIRNFLNFTLTGMQSNTKSLTKIFKSCSVVIKTS